MTTSAQRIVLFAPVGVILTMYFTFHVAARVFGSRIGCSFAFLVYWLASAWIPNI